MLKIVRNDDVAADTTLREIQTFCEICDRYGVRPLHAITPIGTVRNIDCRWDNAQIRREAGNRLWLDNRDVVEYLLSRVEETGGYTAETAHPAYGWKGDLFAVHGLWHTHYPRLDEIRAANTIICASGLNADAIPYYVPPFNEIRENANFSQALNEMGLKVCGAGLPRIEDYLESGDSQVEVMYTHSWRFEYGPFTWDQLDRCLKRLTQQ